MTTVKNAQERRFVLYIALAALVVALAGNILVFFSATATTDRILAQRKIGRILTAKSDLDLCTSVYGNIYDATKAAVKKDTFAYYHRILPSLSNQEIANLVVENRTAGLKQEAQFNPKQCKHLPSQLLTNPPTTTNGL